MVLLMVSLGARMVAACLLSILVLLGGLPFVAAEDAEGDEAEPDGVAVFAGTTSDVRWRVSPDGDDCMPAVCDPLSTTGGRDSVAWVLGFNHSVETVVLELRYEPNTPLSRLALSVACADDPADASCDFVARGTGLLQIRLEREDLAADGIDLAQGWKFDVFVDEGPDATGTGIVTLGAAFWQSYDGAISVFSSGPAPADYSFFR